MDIWVKLFLLVLAGLVVLRAVLGVRHQIAQDAQNEDREWTPEEIEAALLKDHMARLGRAGQAHATGLQWHFDDTLTRSRTLRNKLQTSHPKRPKQVTPTQSAKRLVDGIARNHEVTLFTPHGLTGDADDPSMIIHDLLEAIGVPPRIVNVGADSEMHLGLPHGPDGVDLPHLYVKTVAIGGPADVLSMAQSGALAKALTQAKIAFDADAAAALRKSG